jgi:diguanylate cyclase (GGDEF)-like protein
LLAKAYSDGLTGVGNRALLYDRWQRSLARSSRACRMTGLLVIDINRFKLINDSHGHLAGDAVLQHFASVLKRSVRRSDVIARFGGDEFVIVLERVRNIEEVAAVRDKLQMRYTCLVGEDARRLDYTVSIGGAISDPSLNEDLLDALHRADIEMYQNKAETNGRDLLAVA